ncbi:ketose-bisphosphate aldolase class-II family protein [Quillaja saponaria]|uniref:Ketose-bisphosphate aldolase class-II family protein n=1 Tax=Quillaja saponaria TaxID=32244 RepID=A0AAD7Q5J8_QUISA|nr:ketose-bisphosphate aldolase class-II family protein [Quillaja saponaria]
MASREVVGFVGLDELSLELASSLIRHGYKVQAFEISESMIHELLKLGGVQCASPNEAGRDVTTLIVLISHVDQINDLIFGTEGVLKDLNKDTIVILNSTILPSLIQNLDKRLTDNTQVAYLVDIYVSRGMSEAFNGKVMVTTSGRSDSIARARPILSAMCEKLYIFEGEVGAASKSKMVSELLEGIHLVASVEAVSLGTKAGIHPWIIYDIISNAAGNSWVFKNLVPQLLKGNTRHHVLNIFVQKLGVILDTAKSLTFPLPLLAATHQQLLLGTSLVYGPDDDITLLKVWEKVHGVNITDAANAEPYSPELLATQVTAESSTVRRVGFIGLGAMGFGMATHLLRSNFCVIGYDVYKPTLTRFANAGGLVGNFPAEVSKDVDVLIIMVTNEAQVESVLYGEFGALSALPSGAAIILSSTVSPGYVSQLEHRLQSEGKNLKLVDAPVSGGVKRASNGTLTIIASGTDEALKSTGLVLEALSEKLYVIKGVCGSGSGVKMVNQLLAGVHIASAAEAMAFGARLGLNTRLLFDFIINSGGTSWMFENRVPHMLDNDYTPYSALDIFVKDLGIVSRESSTHRVPLHISTVAHQLFLSGSAAGWGRQDDAGVVKVYEILTGVKVEGKLSALRKEVVLQSLPPEWPQDPINDIKRLHEKNSKVLVVLDDDPTGTQTVHDIEVLTEWSIESLIDQLTKSPKCFFILTNSRSLSSEKASTLIRDICNNLQSAAKSVANIDYTVVLRGDSTLRGHFPEEADSAVSVLGEMDAWIICPFFLQGGRYTIGDVHYVADSDQLVPAGDTEFAKDAAFGYKSSNLREWVEEKTAGRIPASSVISISIQLLRKGGPDAVCECLCSLQKGSTCIVNAASERDMAVFALGMLQAELRGKSFLCRTAASFVSSRIGIIPQAPILPKDLGVSKERNGGLIVVGSYVPKTTKQVEELKSQCSQILRSVEVSVEKLAMRSNEEREEEISRTVEMADIYIRAHKETLIMTSRELITGKNASDSLEINFKVSSALVEIVKRITTKPRYILAKGGITSSDLATKALGARCAKIVGQALAGVPLWQLGPESRHPGVPYIVFPGNVGDSKALAEVVKSWAHPVRLSSTKELLINAEKGGYAVGAFNVYNLEGVEAVIAAAEEQQSPAILQIHPSALKQGGIPLVACCISAAEQASVPITIHFDHGTSKQDLVEALELGFDSVMEDCPGQKMASTVEDYEARLTDVTQAQKFIDETGVDALAVCIGNVHGNYPASGPNLRFNLLKELHALSMKKGVFLVLHGASGVPMELVKECIKQGVRKFNVNTEVRKAYMDSLSSPKKDLVNVMTSAKEAMKVVIAEKMRLFGSAGKA